MRAATLMGVGDVRITERPQPTAGPGELLLRIDMVGLCGTDLNSYRGKNPLITYPRVLGHEIAATVIHGTHRVPSGTTVTVSPYTSCGRCPSCRRGRVNACQFNQTFGVQRDGALTEFLVVSEDKVYPSSLPKQHLALVEPLTVGFHAVARGRVTAGDVVAVFGCGGIGLGVISGAAFRQAHTIAIDVDAIKLETALAAGARDVINATKENVRERLAQLTDGAGPDVVFEAIGLPDTFRMAVEVVAFTGRVVYVGYAKEPVAYETKLFVQKELDIIGSRNALAEDFLSVIAMLKADRFPVDRTISAIVGLDGVPEALAQWSTNPAAFTKIMVEL